MTNQEKFLQIFGQDLKRQCSTKSWWEQEYINPQKSEKWIPVSERLPEEDGQYLITVKYVHVDGYDDIYAEHGEWRDGNWDMFCFGHCGQVEKILAWMPLPTPYKEQESSKEWVNFAEDLIPIIDEAESEEV